MQPIPRRFSSQTALLVAVTLAAAGIARIAVASPDKAEKPNVILVLTDDK